MSEPDELYTLRAQYWLGHYQLALEEAKSVARRPMSPNLKSYSHGFTLPSASTTKQVLPTLPVRRITVGFYTSIQTATRLTLLRLAVSLSFLWLFRIALSRLFALRYF
jgi:hypothetical protein